MFGYNYCCDNVMALQHALEEKYDLTSIQYNMLYSIYAFPNIVLPFLGGVIMDKVGMDLVILFFFILIVIGHGLFILGCMFSYYPLMVIGRFFFGAGSESYAMAISPLICEYFRGKELSFALGLTLALARIGSSINDAMTYHIYERTDNIIIAISVGFVLVVLCLALILFLLCYRMRHIKSKMKIQDTPFLNGQFSNHSNNGPPNGFHKKKIQNGVRYELSITANSRYALSKRSRSVTSREGYPALDASPIRFAHDFSSMRSSKLMEDIECIDISDEGALGSKGEAEDHEFTLSDIKEFDSVYWLLLLNCGLIYGCITPWMNVGADFLQKTFGYHQSLCNHLLMVPYICGGIFTPTLGYLSDRIGKRTQLLFMSCICGG